MEPAITTLAFHLEHGWMRAGYKLNLIRSQQHPTHILNGKKYSIYNNIATLHRAPQRRRCYRNLDFTLRHPVTCKIVTVTVLNSKPSLPSGYGLNFTLKSVHGYDGVRAQWGI